ncbi:MAG TPA: peptidylprolyl isomerase [Terriglobales bacterium]|nr:peptidylprolyl isomerase [Terriglobales bacterium]
MSAEAPAPAPAVPVTDKPVARVNDAVLTDRDLLREMYAIFPYARQHNGFPKEMEAQIRQGALEMIIFEELAYQEAIRRKLAIPLARINRAEADFRKQFSSGKQYQEYLKFECKGSPRVLRERIRRSLLIEALLKVEVQDKAAVSMAETEAFYDKNPKKFEHGESFAIQTISIIPPQNASAEVQKEARKRAEEALRQAKATKNYREFGLLAEKISDDDWHVNMGDRKVVDAAMLPPPLVQVARAMKPGDVSDLLQFGTNYTLFRLNARTPAGKTEFEAVKTRLRSDLQKAKSEQLRAALNQRLRKNAKVKVL